MRFPARDLTDQYISSSYQDVLQQYITSELLYVLDGYGNVVFTLPSASLGNTVITSDVTSSMAILSASYAQTASYIKDVDGGYAGMYMDNNDYVVNITTASVWTKVANGWTASFLDPIHKFEQNHEIRVGQSGYYFAFWELTINTGLFSCEIEGTLGINHVTQSQLTSHQKTSVNGDLDSFSAGNIVYLNSGSTVQVYVRNSSNTMGIIVSHAQLALVRSFGYNAVNNATSASYAGTASIANFAFSSLSSTYSDTASIAISAIYADTASLSAEAISASYAQTASYVTPSSIPHNDLSGLQGGSGSDYYHLDSASYSAISNGTASFAYTASYALNAGSGGTTLETGSIYPITASYAETASFAYTASYISGSLTELNVSGTVIISGSVVISGSLNADHNTLSNLQGGGGGGDYYHLDSASYAALSNGSASYAFTASYALFALNGGGSGSGGASLNTGSYYPITTSYADTASYFSGSIANAVYAQTATSASYAFTSSYTLAGGLSITNYDYSRVEYGGPYGQFSRCTYRVGGISGSIVAIVDAYYSGSLFIGVSKSLG